MKKETPIPLREKMEMRRTVSIRAGHYQKLYDLSVKNNLSMSKLMENLIDLKNKGVPI